MLGVRILNLPTTNPSHLLILRVFETIGHLAFDNILLFNLHHLQADNILEDAISAVLTHTTDFVVGVGIVFSVLLLGKSVSSSSRLCVIINHALHPRNKPLFLS